MATFSLKIVRQLNLLILFLQSRESITFTGIKECIEEYKKHKEETARKLFERDKSDLRKMGIPLNFNKSEGTYEIEKQRFYLQKIDLTDEEKILLRVMINLLLNTYEFPIFKDELILSVQKLAASYKTPYKVENLLPSYMLTSQLRKTNEGIARILSIIATAIFEKKRLYLQYAAQEEKTEGRSVDPLGMIFREGTAYMVAFCHLRQAIRIFNVSRISNLKIVEIEKDDTPFKVPVDFKIEKYSKREIWEFDIEPPFIAEVRFSSEISWIIENQFKKKAPIERLSNGDILFKPTVTNMEGFANFVLSFGDKAIAEKPEKLRQYLRNEICSILYEYDKLL